MPLVLAIKQKLKPYFPEWVLDLRFRNKLVDEAKRAGFQVKQCREYVEVVRGKRAIRISSANIFYLPEVARNFDYYFEAVVSVAWAGKELIDFSKPNYHMLRGFEHFPVLLPTLSESFEAVSEYTEFAQLKEGDVVLDLGAYAGITSIAFGMKVGKTGRVLAFEPDTTNYPCAKENIRKAAEILGLSNITLSECAVWSHGDGLVFSVEGGMSSSAVSIVGDWRGDNKTVPSITLDKICEQERLARVDFIKMDIEGAEVEVLESSRDILSRFRPRLVIESHFVSDQLTTEACTRILLEMNYKVDIIEQLESIFPLIMATPCAAK